MEPWAPFVDQHSEYDGPGKVIVYSTKGDDHGRAVARVTKYQIGTFFVVNAPRGDEFASEGASMGYLQAHEACQAEYFWLDSHLAQPVSIRLWCHIGCVSHGSYFQCSLGAVVFPPHPFCLLAHRGSLQLGNYRHG